MLINIADVSFLQDISQLNTTVQERNFTLVVIELSKDWKDDLYAVQSLKLNFPNILIVIVNGGGTQEAVIQSFRSGGVDFFKKPYDKKLLAERVEALIKKNTAQEC